jgi:hypothetical protein
MKLSTLFKKNQITFIIGVIILVFFSFTFIHTWRNSSPIISNDDWRFLKLFLIPFMNGELRFSQLWGDPVHPEPLSAIYFILCAKYDHLQLNYPAYFGIIFQLGMFIILVMGLFESFSHFKNRNLFVVLATIILSLIWFSFTYTTQYEWWLVTIRYVEFFFFFLVIYLINKAILGDSGKLRLYLSIAILDIFGLLISYHFAIFLNFAIIVILLISMLVDKKVNRNQLKLFGVILISLILSKLFLSNTSMPGKSYQTIVFQNFIVIITHLIKTIESVGIAYMSAILNIGVLNKIGIPIKLIEIISILTFIIFLSNLFLFFQQKIYQKSIFPGFLMIFSLAFIASVLLVKFNPTGNLGIFCLTWNRYIVMYQIGLIGFIWNSFLLLQKYQLKYPKQLKRVLVASILLIVSLSLNWGFYYHLAIRNGKYYREVLYPRITANLKSPDLTIVRQTLGEKNATKQSIQFLKENSFNIFAPDFPYQQNNDSVQVIQEIKNSNK